MFIIETCLPKFYLQCGVANYRLDVRQRSISCDFTAQKFAALSIFASLDNNLWIRMEIVAYLKRIKDNGDNQST